MKCSGGHTTFCRPGDDGSSRISSVCLRLSVSSIAVAALGGHFTAPRARGTPPHGVLPGAGDYAPPAILCTCRPCFESSMRRAGEPCIKKASLLLMHADAFISWVMRTAVRAASRGRANIK